MVEDRRLDEEAALHARAAHPGAAANQPRPFALADADVFEHGVELRVVDRRTDVGLRVEAVADDELCGAGVEPLDEFVGDRVLDHRAARRGAALAGGPKGALDRALDREVQIRIREDHDRILAAHLALAFDAARRGGGVERHADVVGSRERHRLDGGVLHDRVTDLAAAAVDEIQDARAGCRTTRRSRRSVQR